VTPQECLALLEAVRDKAAKAAPDMAMAMGRAHQDHLTRVTLSRFQSVPMERTPSPPGAPPAAMTGRLRGSVTCVQGASSGVVGRSVVGPHTIYAATQEWGGVHYGRPHMWLWLRYAGAEEVRRRGWVKRVVHIPERPYMRPSRDEVIANGAITAAASASLMRQIFG
jgi:phage gpG-like protein